MLSVATVQLLRCEVENAKAETIECKRRVANDVAAAAQRVKENERLTQIRLSTRLHALEAELAAMTKRMADQKK